MAYYTDADLRAVSDELLVHFDFDLTSVSTLPAIARVCAGIMRDHGLEPRKSLCLMLAQRAKLAWAARIIAVQAGEDPDFEASEARADRYHSRIDSE